MQHMESNMCHGVTKDQFLRARMINALIRGVFDNGNENSAQDEPSKPANLNMTDEEQFPSLGDSNRRERNSATEPDRDAVTLKTDEEESCADQSADDKARLSESQMNGPKHSRERRELNQEQLRRLQDLSKKMLGADTGIRQKRREDGELHSMEVRHPLSPFFNAELFRNTQGHFECPFQGCE